MYYEYLQIESSRWLVDSLREGCKYLKSIFTDWKCYLVFIVTWLVLMSPAIVGYTIGIIFDNKYALTLATGYIALTSVSPIPVPIIPMCFASVIIYKKRISQRRNLK